MTQPQPGDEVRVVIQGVVSTDWAKLESLIASVGGSVETLEVLPKPLKVGDTLLPDDYVRARRGTVAVDKLSGVLLFKQGSNVWVDTAGGTWRDWELRSARTIVFLPDAA